MENRKCIERGMLYLYLLSGLLVTSLLLTACLPRGFRIPQHPLLANLERKSGLIVYVGTDRNIYTIDQGGGRKNAVTSDAQLDEGAIRVYQFPAWSPDSRRIAFVGISGTNSSNVAASLYTASPNGKDLVETFTSRDQIPFYLYWSPDGENLSFLSTSSSGEDLFLQIVPARGGEIKILDTGQPYYWVWSPDTQSILAHTGGAVKTRPQARLSFLELNNEVHQRKLDLRPTFFQAPAWSPDGEALIMAAEADDGEEVLLLTDSKGMVKNILAKISGSVAFSWSPDGKKLGYITNENRSQPDSSRRLTVLDLKNLDQAKTSEEEPVIAFFWSPDSQMVALFVPRTFLPTSNQQQDGQTNVTVVLDLVVFDLRSGDSKQLVSFVPTDQFSSILQNFDQYHRSTTIWSPDSRNIVISALDGEGNPGIYIVDANGVLEVRFISEGNLALWSWK